jgi:PST family polysaccharide transporter
LRVLIRSELGLSDAGQFQAAFAVTTYYVGFVFAALATDYLPLLSGLASDTAQMNRAANTQLSVATLISAPPVMLLVATAPLVVPLLYSGSFDQTPDLLRIMLLGEATRVAAWTVGYILVARSAGRLFVATEVLYNALLLAVSAALLPVLGLTGVGVSYLTCQLASLLWTLWFAKRTSGFRLTRSNGLTLVAVLVAQGLVYAGVAIGGVASAFAWALAAACGYGAWRRLQTLTGGPLSAVLRAPLRDTR